MAQKTKAQLTELAEANDVDISNAKTNADIEQALADAGVDTGSTPQNDDLQTSDDRDAALPSSELQDEARELGIEPNSYHTSNELQERIDHVRAEKEAVGGDTSISEARAEKPGSNANLNTASDEDAGVLSSRNTQ